MSTRNPERALRLAFLLTLWFVHGAVQAQTSLQASNLEAILAARQDVWALAAMREPNGPSYDFFSKLLPPLRYVDAAFRHYPIVLSAPNAPVKARWVSNGSGLNARSGHRSWREFSVPVSFRVGAEGAAFGADLQRLDGPRYDAGYLPIVQVRYEYAGQVYEQEAFAAVEPALASNGVVFVRFSLGKGDTGQVAAQLESSGSWTVSGGAVRNASGQAAAWFDDSWKWEDSRKQLTARFRKKQRPTLAFATRPDLRLVASPAAYAKHRARCVTTWQSLLDQGTQIDVPEPRVNDAWRALVVSLFTLVKGDHLNYSAGNGYDRQYGAECGDAVRALLLFGQEDEARRTLLPLLDYVQKGVGYHDSGFKLQMLAHHFWLTRDANLVAATRKQWQREADHIIDGREAANGLLPRENYCGDIPTQVYSLNSSANSWRGLRDFAAVLETAGDRPTAQRLRETAAAFRQSILAAVEKSERRDVQPTFIPIALFGEEQPYDVLTATKLGGYWCLMAPYVLGSGVFGPGAARERAIVDYLQEHGGVAMGLIRFDMHAGLYANSDALDDLYGLRYTLKLLELDEVDRAVTGFYGKLAQGLTRDTFLGAEGTGLRPADEFGRPMFLPPNSSSQAYFLWTLRYLLVQDWDLDDDGQPETLRLGFATPRPWLAHGKTIKVERAPTAFGEISMKLTSRLNQGEVVAELDLPKRNPARQTLLRIRVPDGWRVNSAKAGRSELKVDERGTVDVTSLRSKSTVHFTVVRR